MKKIALSVSTCIALCASALAQNPYTRWNVGHWGDSSFFPIGVWVQEPGDAAAYKAAGITCYIGLWAGPTEQQLSGMRSAGMPVICEQNAVGLAHRNDSLIIGWNWGDEPDNAQWNEGTQSYDPCISTDSVTRVYDRMRAADTTRPLYLNLGMGVSWTGWYGRGTCTNRIDMYPGYCSGPDIVSYDIYPVVSTDATIRGQLQFVPKGIDSLRSWSGGKPSWCWIECTHISNPDAKPTPAQVKAEVWMALIHGAMGFGYFCHEFPPAAAATNHNALLDDTAMLSAVRAINTRVKFLAPVLYEPTVPGGATVSSSNAAVPVQLMVKHHGGSTYLFAVPMRAGATLATFRLADTTYTGSGIMLESWGAVTITNGTFQDSLKDWGVAMYSIGGTATVAQPPADHRSAPSSAAPAAWYDLAGRRVGMPRPSAMPATGLRLRATSLPVPCLVVQ